MNRIVCTNGIELIIEDTLENLFEKIYIFGEISNVDNWGEFRFVGDKNKQYDSFGKPLQFKFGFKLISREDILDQVGTDSEIIDQLFWYKRIIKIEILLEDLVRKMKEYYNTIEFPFITPFCYLDILFLSGIISKQKYVDDEGNVGFIATPLFRGNPHSEYIFLELKGLPKLIPRFRVKPIKNTFYNFNFRHGTLYIYRKMIWKEFLGWDTGRIKNSSYNTKKIFNLNTYKENKITSFIIKLQQNLNFIFSGDYFIGGFTININQEISTLLNNNCFLWLTKDLLNNIGEIQVQSILTINNILHTGVIITEPEKIHDITYTEEIPQTTTPDIIDNITITPIITEDQLDKDKNKNKYEVFIGYAECNNGDTQIIFIPEHFKNNLSNFNMPVRIGNGYYILYFSYNNFCYLDKPFYNEELGVGKNKNQFKVFLLLDKSGNDFEIIKVDEKNKYVTILYKGSTLYLSLDNNFKNIINYYIKGG